MTTAPRKKKAATPPLPRRDLFLPSPETPKRIVQAYRNVFNSPEGELVVNDMIRSYIMRDSFVPGDPCASAYNDGQKALVLSILAIAEGKIDG